MTIHICATQWFHRTSWVPRTATSPSDLSLKDRMHIGEAYTTDYMNVHAGSGTETGHSET